MGSWDVRLIQSSFMVEEDTTIVKLYGRTRDGESITILKRGYLPYYHLVDPTPDARTILSNKNDVLALEDDTLFYRGEDHPVLKVTYQNPWKISNHRDFWHKQNMRVLSADISVPHRYAYDEDMGACIRVTGEKIEDIRFSTDIVVDMASFENIDPFDPGLKIMSFDIENSIAHEFIYTICAVVDHAGKRYACPPIVGKEKDIILGFTELIRNEDPDVITGYNIDNYDITVISDRAESNRIKKSLTWGRDGSLPKVNPNSGKWKVEGRVVIDAWKEVKKEIRPKQETLNAVANLLLGESKLDVDSSRIDVEWAENRSKVLEYCVKDCNLALDILLKVGSVRKKLDLASVVKLPLEDVADSGTSLFVDSMLIRLADKNKVGIPPMGARRKDSDMIQGGYVHTMVAGLYHWVCVEDFKSMYPSTMIAKNICFTTMSPEGDIVSPTGTRFLSPEKRMGLLPSLLKDLMEQRDATKRKMKAAKDRAEHDYYDGLQSAIKIVMNTFYGVFASDFYRFTDKNIGAAITAFARNNTVGIIEAVQKEGVNVVYSDTDSIFMQSPYEDLEGAVKFGNEMAERFSVDGGTLEFEKLIEPMFTHGKKKRYVGKIVWPEEADELLIRGYETRRSDSFDALTELQTKMFELILEGKDEELLALTRDTLDKVGRGEVDPSKLVISKNCKGVDHYKNPQSMANVQAATKIIRMGQQFIPGSKVSWIVTDSKKTPQEVEPYISGLPFTARPDYMYYKMRLAAMAASLTEAFGWTEADLMVGTRQKTLMGFDNGDAPQTRKTKNQTPPPKVARLDDFF